MILIELAETERQILGYIKMGIELSWRKVTLLKNDLEDKVDLDQKVINQELSLSASLRIVLRTVPRAAAAAAANIEKDSAGGGKEVVLRGGERPGHELRVEG